MSDKKKYNKLLIKELKKVVKENKKLFFNYIFLIVIFSFITLFLSSYYINKYSKNFFVVFIFCYFILSFIFIFFNVAFSHSLKNFNEKQSASIFKSIFFASSKIIPIILFSIFYSIFGFFSQYFLIIPVMIHKNISLSKSLKESKKLIKNQWNFKSKKYFNFENAFFSYLLISIILLFLSLVIIIFISPIGGEASLNMIIFTFSLVFSSILFMFSALVYFNILYFLFNHIVYVYLISKESVFSFPEEIISKSFIEKK